ncbi:MAG TPA: hypothetical protein VGS04_02390 [Nitrososphaerales archaeon]|nr:hypothetical protein [Nitrososphaerales archaeon]
MSEPAEVPSRSLASKYATKEALIYYALVLPALVAEAVFSVAIVSTPGDLLTQAAPGGSAVAAGLQLLPWALLAASVYAVFSFRPSLLVTLLVASFFVAASVANGIALLGAQLDLGGTVILVVATTFLALAGFNYARGVKLLGGRRPIVTSSGPLGYNVLGLALESVFPLAVALALVVLVETIVGDLGAQSARLPAPLSELASLYLQSRIGIIFTTLFVAGAAIWVMRQFLEPVMLHFTLNATDAKKELLAEIEPTTKSVRKISRYRPSRGLVWGLLTIAYCIGLIAALAIFLPRGQFSSDLLAAVDLHARSPTLLERLLESSIQKGLVRVNILYAQSQDFIRQIIQLLWG